MSDLWFLAGLGLGIALVAVPFVYYKLAERRRGGR